MELKYKTVAMKFPKISWVLQKRWDGGLGSGGPYVPRLVAVARAAAHCRQSVWAGGERQSRSSSSQQSRGRR